MSRVSPDVGTAGRLRRLGADLGAGTLASAGAWLAVHGSSWTFAALALALLAVSGRAVTMRRQSRRRSLLNTQLGQRALLGAAATVALARVSPASPLPAVLGGVLLLAALMYEPYLRQGAAVRVPVVAHLPGIERRPRPDDLTLQLFVGDLVVLAVGLLVGVLGGPAWWWALVSVLALVSRARIARDSLRRAAQLKRLERDLQGAVEAYQPEIALYTSWPTADGTHQVTMWLPYLQRTGRRCMVITRNSATADALADLVDIPVVQARGPEDLDKLTPDSLRAAFYPNASSGNGLFVRYQQLTHVFLGHGDSDKPTSFNPTHAMYNRIFCAGPAAIRRYADHGVVITPEKFQVVGRPQVESIETAGAPVGSITDPVVLYAPTWRGHVSETSVSSLLLGERIVRGLLAAGATVLFRPHPFSRRYPEDLAVIRAIQELLAADRTSTGRRHLWGEEAETSRSIEACFNASDALVTDVSSVASDYLFSGKPIAMVATTGSPEDFREAYPVSRAAYVVQQDLGDLAGSLALMLGSDPLATARRAQREDYLGAFPAQGYASAFVEAVEAVVSAPQRARASDQSADEAVLRAVDASSTGTDDGPGGPEPTGEDPGGGDQGTEESSTEESSTEESSTEESSTEESSTEESSTEESSTEESSTEEIPKVGVPALREGGTQGARVTVPVRRPRSRRRRRSRMAKLRRRLFTTRRWNQAGAGLSLLSLSAALLGAPGLLTVLLGFAAVGAVYWAVRPSLRRRKRWSRLLAEARATRLVLLCAALVAWPPGRLAPVVELGVLVVLAWAVIAESHVQRSWGRLGLEVRNFPAMRTAVTEVVPRGVLPMASAVTVLVALLLVLTPVLGWVLLAATLLVLALAVTVTARALGRAARVVRAEFELPGALTALAPEFAVYLGSTIGVGYQIGMWIPYFMRLGRPFIVVTRSADTLSELGRTLRQHGCDAPVICRPTLRGLEDVLVPTLTTAFYVNNAARNTHFIERRELTHVWLNHGDSEKPACYNPVHAIYDLIFAAGQAGIDRYARHGVHIPREKFRVVGRPQVEVIQVAQGERSPDVAPTVLYAPTWQGPYADTRLYSLPLAVPIVQRLLERGVRVICRVHPLNYEFPHSAAMVKQVNRLLARHRRETGTEHVFGRAAESAMTVEDCFNASDAMIADVSAVVSDYLYSDKPFAIVAVGRTNAQLLAEAPAARAAYVVAEDLSNLDPVLDALLESDPLASTRQATREYYLGDFPREHYAEGFLDAARTVIDARSLPERQRAAALSTGE